MYITSYILIKSKPCRQHVYKLFITLKIKLLSKKDF